METLAELGKQFKLEKTMLTVLKGEPARVPF